MTFQFVRSPHGQPSIEIPAIGVSLTVPLCGSTNDGALEVIETINSPGFGPPLHRHAQTEVFRVMSGRFLFEVDGERFIAEAGDLVSVPGGAAHGFVNVGDEPASQLVMISPSFDAIAFFTGLGEVTKDGIPSPETLAAFGKRWGVEFLGPPLSASSPDAVDTVVDTARPSRRLASTSLEAS